MQRGKNMRNTLLEEKSTKIKKILKKNLAIKEKWDSTAKFTGPLCCIFISYKNYLKEFALFPKVYHAKFRLAS
jgi:hypothetical protein